MTATERTWLEARPCARPWVHAGAAGVAGAVLAIGSVYTAVPFLFGVVWAVPVLLVVAAAVFAGIGVVFLRSRRGLALATTVLLWVPATIAGFAVSVAEDDGQLDPTRPGWATLVIPGAAAAIAALIGHRGAPRWIGAGVAVLTIGTAIVVTWNAQQAQRIQEAQQSLGSTLRPEVATVPGYSQRSDPTIAGDGSDALVTGFVRDDGHPTPAVGFEFAVVTATGSTPICGRPLLRVGANGASEPERSCTRASGGWWRTSEHGVELVRHVDGLRVGLLAPAGTSESLLRRALASARPMDDHYYRHLLLGEQGEYVRELDGNR